MLLFLSPVVVGLHILFSAFWPRRILFFSNIHRKSFLSGQLWQWGLTLLILGLALAINLFVVDELQASFNESLPFLSVYIRRKIGWMIGVAASIMAIASSLCFVMVYAILAYCTGVDQEISTNKQLECQEILKKKKKVTSETTLSDKYECEMQVKYKKERNNGWTWLLPILLCMGACAVSLAGYFHPKLAIVIEQKGATGKAIDSVLDNVSLYENEMTMIEEQAQMDCFPFATIKDMLKESVNERFNLLLQFTGKFFNRTRELIQPLKDLITRTQRQAFNDIGEAIVGEENFEDIKNLKNINFAFLPLFVLITRGIQLLILILGIFFEPTNIVAAFGSLCKFSFFFCILSQMALFDVLTSFGIPFYRVYIKYGLGFMYDVASEAIMWSIWILLCHPKGTF